MAPSGTPRGSGSPGAPWDLETALGQPPEVAPGDTIWLHRGTYVGQFHSTLTGLPDARVVVRSFPGEWATLDGAGGSPDDFTLSVGGAWVDFVDFEVTSSDPRRVMVEATEGRPGGLRVEASNVRFINLVVHDTGDSFMGSLAVDTEVYGCLFYSNGWDISGQRGMGAGLSLQNATGTKTIEDNIIFGGYSFGVHASAQNGLLRNLHFIGNTYFNAGVASDFGGRKDNLLLGGGTPAGGIIVRGNMSWAPSNTSRSTQLGYYATVNDDVVVEDNYFVLGSLNLSQPWASVTMTGNTFYENVLGTVAAADHPANTALTALPTSTRIFVRPNRYEAGRANVTVYNWADTPSVGIDLSSVLAPGDRFEVRNGQDFFGPPVVEGVYSVGPVEVPLVGLEPAQPIGAPNGYGQDERTGPQFNVFVVRRLPPRSGDGGVPTDAGLAPDGDRPGDSGTSGGAGEGSAHGVRYTIGCGCGQASAASAAWLALVVGWLASRRGRRSAPVTARAKLVAGRGSGAAEQEATEHMRGRHPRHASTQRREAKA